MARAFFFPHAREGGALGDRPGRVPFEITGALVDSVAMQQGSAMICADGYGPNQCASNQDPCVFSAPIGPVHSYCRLDNPKGKDHYVLETGGRHNRFLSSVVTNGDVILYGKVHRPNAATIDRIWIDTVIRVKRKVAWPTTVKSSPKTRCGPHALACKTRKYQLRSPAAFASLLGVQTTSDVYRFNLRDADFDGAHCCSGNDDPRVIEGVVGATPEAVVACTTSFVPLADRVGEEWWPAFIARSDVSAADWTDYTAFFDATVRRNTRSGFISEMNENLALRLCHAIVAVSGRAQGRPGTVAIPPLQPSPDTTRWSPAQRAFVLP